MNYLLDTHKFIWTISESYKLTTIEREIIADESNSIFVSTISIWEISIKFGLGKLNIKGIVPEDFLDAVKTSGFILLETTPSEIVSYYYLPKVYDHKDPFDRLLIWQCIKNNFMILSSDPKFEAYKDFGLKIFK